MDELGREGVANLGWSTVWILAYGALGIGELDGAVRTAAAAAAVEWISCFPVSLFLFFCFIGVWWFEWASSGGRRISIDQLDFGGPLAGLWRSGRRYQRSGICYQEK
jgi:hypothetical protein